jgi:hypothetical protein
MEISKLHCHLQTVVSAWRVWIDSTEKWRHSTSMCCSTLLPFNVSVQCAFCTVNCKRSQMLVMWGNLSSEAMALVFRNTAVTFYFVLCENEVCIF